MSDILLTIPGAPTAKGRPRFSRRSGRAYTPAKTAQAESTFASRAAAALLTATEWASDWPTATAARVDLVFVLPIPASWPAWKREAALAGDVRPVSKPDIDNLAKLAKDALNGVLWVDDSQVVELRAHKVYGAEPKTCIYVAELAHQTQRRAA